MGKGNIPLSVAVITKNEEERIGDCLESVAFGEDIVVVDSLSSDRTVEIAKSHGARVFVEEWKGYGPQMESAVAKCKNKWVLILDADERIPPETGREILRILEQPAADAYSFPRRNYLHGKWIRHSDWWPDRVVRLVNKNRGSFHSRTHGKWVTEGKLDNNIKSPIEHFSFSSYSDMLTTMNNYSTAVSKELYRKGKTTNPFIPVVRACIMFFKIYFLKWGFLDGFDGLVIALTKAGGSYFKYAKLLEMQRMKK